MERLRTHAVLADERRGELLAEEIVITVNLARCTWRITPSDGRGGETVTFDAPAVVRAMAYLVAVMRRVGRRRQPVHPFFKARPAAPPAGPCPGCGGTGYVQDGDGNWCPCVLCGAG